MLDNANNTNLPTAAEPTAALDGRDSVTLGADVTTVKYNPFEPNQASLERGYDAEENIKPRSRDQYVELFQHTEKRTAIATLTMCRVTYEAKKTLSDCDFSDFCKAIGYKDDSPTIRKFCAIGKVQPRLMQFAHQLPHEWSKIYTITQMPARAFEIYAEDGYDFRDLKGKDLDALLSATRQPKRIVELLPRDKDSRAFVVAKVLFTTPVVDAYDWRAAKKAFAEIESRLPIRIQFVQAADVAYEHTKTQRYNQAKKVARDVEFQPSKWDFGTEANQQNWDVKPQPETDEQH